MLFPHELTVFEEMDDPGDDGLVAHDEGVGDAFEMITRRITALQPMVTPEKAQPWELAASIA